MDEIISYELACNSFRIVLRRPDGSQQLITPDAQRDITQDEIQKFQCVFGLTINQQNQVVVC